MYSIEYDLDGGRFSVQPTNSAFFDVAFDVPIPTRVGYTFLGWNVSEGIDSSTAVWIVRNGTEEAAE